MTGTGDNTPVEPQVAITADLADLMIAQLNVWMAIEALGRELPAGSAARGQLALSSDGLTKALGSIMRRHNMDISWSVDEQRTAPDA